MDFTREIKGHILEYLDASHTYLVDGVIVPSITQVLGWKFNTKYDHVSGDVLKRASDKGTAVHQAIEDYCRKGIDDGSTEVRNFRFLEDQYKFDVIENEIPVILFMDGEPVSAGRLDIVMQMDGQVGGADIKATATLDKVYLSYQLNLYRIAYAQCYGITWSFLKGIHLKDSKRKLVDIPVNEKLALQVMEEYINGHQ